MNNLRAFKRFIVVEAETGKPMSFQDNQFCYCTSEVWEDWHWPVKTYSYNYAKKLIAKSIAYRKKRKFSVTNYLLVPFSNR